MAGRWRRQGMTEDDGNCQPYPRRRRRPCAEKNGPICGAGASWNSRRWLGRWTEGPTPRRREGNSPIICFFEQEAINRVAVAVSESRFKFIKGVNILGAIFLIRARGSCCARAAAQGRTMCRGAGKSGANMHGIEPEDSSRPCPVPRLQEGLEPFEWALKRQSRQLSRQRSAASISATTGLARRRRIVQKTAGQQEGQLG